MCPAAPRVCSWLRRAAGTNIMSAISPLVGKRICITGGCGCLGSFVVEELQRRGCRDIFIPLIQDYDLTTTAAIERLFADARPEVLFHLAAKVGGIGANRRNPGQFFYDNAAMGIHLIESARLFGIKKFVYFGTVCSYPKITPVPFREDDLWLGYPEETNGPY